MWLNFKPPLNLFQSGAFCQRIHELLEPGAMVVFAGTALFWDIALPVPISYVHPAMIWEESIEVDQGRWRWTGDMGHKRAVSCVFALNWFALRVSCACRCSAGRVRNRPNWPMCVLDDGSYYQSAESTADFSWLHGPPELTRCSVELPCGFIVSVCPDLHEVMKDMLTVGYSPMLFPSSSSPPLT